MFYELGGVPPSRVVELLNERAKVVVEEEEPAAKPSPKPAKVAG